MAELKNILKTLTEELEIGAQGLKVVDAMLVSESSNTITGPRVLFNKSRGDFVTPVPVVTGDEIMDISSGGYDGSITSVNDVRIVAVANQNFGVAAHGAYLKFETTLNGTIVPLERVRIDHNGNMGVGTDNPLEILHLLRNIAGNCRLKIENPSINPNAQASLELKQGGKGFTYFVKDDDSFKIFAQSSAKVISINDATGSMSINSNNLADASAVLDLVSATKGFLKPRMTTTQRDAIPSPINGLEIYNTTTSQPEFYDGGSWTIATLVSLTNPALNLAQILENGSATGGTSIVLSAGDILRALNAVGVNDPGSILSIRAGDGGATSGNGGNVQIDGGIPTSGNIGDVILQTSSTGKVGVGGAPDPSAVFAVNSITKGILQPRMTTVQRDAIPSPVNGLQLYNIDTHHNNTYKDGVWRGEGICDNTLIDSASSAASFALVAGTTLQLVFGGVAIGTVTDPVMINAAGLITVNKLGCYDFALSVNGESTTNATITIWYRLLINGGQVGPTFQQTFTASGESTSIRSRIKISVPAGVTITFEALSNSSNAQLSQHDPFSTNAAWGTPAQAQSIIIQEFSLE